MSDDQLRDGPMVIAMALRRSRDTKPAGSIQQSIPQKCPMCVIPWGAGQAKNPRT